MKSLTYIIIFISLTNISLYASDNRFLSPKSKVETLMSRGNEGYLFNRPIFNNILPTILFDNSKRINTNPNKILFIDMADLKKWWKQHSEEDETFDEYLLKNNIKDNNDIKEMNEVFIKKHIELPAQQLVRDLVAAGKRPFWSNAYSSDIKIVRYRELSSNDSFKLNHPFDNIFRSAS